MILKALSSRKGPVVPWAGYRPEQGRREGRAQERG